MAPYRRVCVCVCVTHTHTHTLRYAVITSSVILFLIYEIPVPPIAQKPFALFRKLWLVLSFTRKAQYQSQHSPVHNIHLMSPVLCTKYFRRSSTRYIQTIILYTATNMKMFKENSSVTSTFYYCHKLHTSSTYTRRSHILTC